MGRIDARELGRQAFWSDHEAMRGRPKLLAAKVHKQLSSPFAFLRGQAATFYTMLEEEPDLEAGPEGTGTLVGDAHLENFGAYRVDRAYRARPPKGVGGTREVAFDVNDFDDTWTGPFRYDVVRLATSFLLASRTHGLTGASTLASLDRLLEGYAAGAFGGALPRVPEVVTSLVGRVEARSARDFLDARTTGRGKRRRFVRDGRYLPLDRRVAAELPRAMQVYSDGLPEPSRLSNDELPVIDAALRVAGNGSLGVLRIAVLVRGKDEGWLFDLKEEPPLPAPARLVPGDRGDPVGRVIAAFTTCVARPPSRLGRTRAAGRDLLVRRLGPEEDKLDATKLSRDELTALVPYVGSLLGLAHARTAPKRRKVLRGVDLRDLGDRAVVLAGLHETAFLGYAREATSAPRGYSFSRMKMK